MSTYITISNVSSYIGITIEFFKFTSQFVFNFLGINFFAIPFFDFGEVVACLFGNKLFSNVLGPSPSSTASRLQHERIVMDGSFFMKEL